jgi:hypothetical protein
MIDGDGRRMERLGKKKGGNDNDNDNTNLVAPS